MQLRRRPSSKATRVGGVFFFFFHGDLDIFLTMFPWYGDLFFARAEAFVQKH